MATLLSHGGAGPEVAALLGCISRKLPLDVWQAVSASQLGARAEGMHPLPLPLYVLRAAVRHSRQRATPSNTP